MPTEENLTGNRFIGHYAKSRKFADINDRKQRGSLRMLTWMDMTQLRDRMQALARAHADTKKLPHPFDVKYPEKSSKLTGLNYEDVSELAELAGRLAELLQPDMT